jgi:hypothetical protein
VNGYELETPLFKYHCIESENDRWATRRLRGTGAQDLAMIGYQDLSHWEVNISWSRQVTRPMAIALGLHEEAKVPYLPVSNLLPM